MANNKKAVKQKKTKTAIAHKFWKCEIIGKRFEFKPDDILELTPFEFEVLAGAEIVSAYKQVRA